MTEADNRVISPAPDARVRHPGGALLGPGDTVAWSSFWDRRLSDGEIVLGDAPAVTATGKKG